MFSVKALQSHTTALHRLSFSVHGNKSLGDLCQGRGGSVAAETFSIAPSLTLLIPSSLRWLTVMMRGERVTVKCGAVSRRPHLPAWPHHPHPTLFPSFFKQIHVWDDDLSLETSSYLKSARCCAALASVSSQTLFSFLTSPVQSVQTNAKTFLQSAYKYAYIYKWMMYFTVPNKMTNRIILLSLNSPERYPDVRLHTSSSSSWNLPIWGKHPIRWTKGFTMGIREAPRYLLCKAHPDREKTSDLKRNTIESKIWAHSWLCRMCVVWENKEKDAAGTVLTLSACQVWYLTSCCQSFYTSMHRNRYRAIISTELW